MSYFQYRIYGDQFKNICCNSFGRKYLFVRKNILNNSQSSIMSFWEKDAWYLKSEVYHRWQLVVYFRYMYIYSWYIISLCLLSLLKADMFETELIIQTSDSQMHLVTDLYKDKNVKDLLFFGTSMFCMFCIISHFFYYILAYIRTLAFVDVSTCSENGGLVFRWTGKWMNTW